MIQRAAIAIALTCAVGFGGYLYGRADGRGLERGAMAQATARMQASLIEVGALATEQAAKIAGLESRSDQILREAEDEASNDPLADTCRPGPDSLRKTKDIWRRVRAAP